VRAGTVQLHLIRRSQSIVHKVLPVQAEDLLASLKDNQIAMVSSDRWPRPLIVRIKRNPAVLTHVERVHLMDRTSMVLNRLAVPIVLRGPELEDWRAEQVRTHQPAFTETPSVDPAHLSGANVLLRLESRIPSAQTRVLTIDCVNIATGENLAKLAIEGHEPVAVHRRCDDGGSRIHAAGSYRESSRTPGKKSFLRDTGSAAPMKATLLHRISRLSRILLALGLQGCLSIMVEERAGPLVQQLETLETFPIDAPRVQITPHNDGLGWLVTAEQQVEHHVREQTSQDWKGRRYVFSPFSLLAGLVQCPTGFSICSPRIPPIICSGSVVPAYSCWSRWMGRCHCLRPFHRRFARKLRGNRCGMASCRWPGGSPAHAS
jgi:hypothetical protein